MTLTPAMKEALLTGCVDAQDRTVQALERRALWDGGYYTPLGLAEFEKLGGKVERKQMVRLGTPMTFRFKDKHLQLAKGSELLVVFGGMHGRYQYWDCFAGKEYPIARVFRHSGHKFFEIERPVYATTT